MKKVLLLAVMAILLISCNNTSKIPILDDGNKCAIMSEDFVKSKLKYPEETDFQTSSFVHEREGCAAIILNRFTSKNGFGVTITYTYKIWLQFKGGEWNDINNWSYDKLIIEGSDGTKVEF